MTNKGANAFGANSDAYAYDGSNDSATAIGAHTIAFAGSGNNDSASVLDPFSTDGSQAAALNGDGNFASVFGDNDSASASGWYHVYLGNNIAEVFGTGKLG